jgi:hypothetical protein
MPDKQFTGVIDGDLGNGGNYVPAGVPISGDRIFFTGARTISAGFNQSAVDPLEVIVPEAYSGLFGNSSDFVEYGTISTLRFSSGGASAFLRAATITEALIAGGVTSEDMLHLDATASMPEVEIGDAGGRVTIEPGSALGNVRLDGRAAQLFVGAGVTGFNSLVSTGGLAELFTASGFITLLEISRAVIHPGAGGITTLQIRGQSTCQYNGDGLVGTLDVSGPAGQFDGTQNDVGGPVTVTNAAVRPGGIIDARNGRANFVFTNGVEVLDGIYRPDYGQTLLVA